MRTASSIIPSSLAASTFTPRSASSCRLWRSRLGRCRRFLQVVAKLETSPVERPYSTVLIVPTGVGASIGGFAGDALPVARAMASLCDCLVTHPNVLNAAMLYWPMHNTLYVEGYALDRFAEGEWGLAPVHQNKIGLVLDSAIERDLQLRHLQVADAARASLGLSITEYITTDSPLGVEKWINAKTGQSTGHLLNPDSLMRAVDTLVNKSDVNAVAVVARFPDDNIKDISEYRQGQVGLHILCNRDLLKREIICNYNLP